MHEPITFHRVRALPDEPQRNAVYFVRTGNQVRMWLVGFDGTLRSLTVDDARINGIVAALATQEATLENIESLIEDIETGQDIPDLVILFENGLV